MMKTQEIQIRDPFIVPHAPDQTYYMFGTIDKNCWRGPGQGFDCYKSKDLETWQGPIPAFRPPASFWGKENFWAPEVHAWHGRYLMLTTFKAERRYRATHILVSSPQMSLQSRPQLPVLPLAPPANIRRFLPGICPVPILIPRLH